MEHIENIQQTKMDCYRKLFMLRTAIYNVDPEAEEIKRIDKMLENLNSRQYVVGVVGEFNRGKSSLINALLGLNILPADIVPTTATVNRVVYSDTQFVRLLMRDGQIEEGFPVSELKSRVTKITRDFESASELVEEAVIGYPTVLCQNNVSILDTPGLNENPAMNALTVEQMDQVDALIFALRLDLWFSDSEAREVCELLKYPNIRHVLFTVGFIDIARKAGGDIDQDLADIRKDIIKKTNRVIEKDPEINEEDTKRIKSMIENAAVMGISAKDALDSFVNGNQQQRKDSRIAEYKTELMTRLTAQADEWLIYEVLPYLKNQKTVFQSVAHRNLDAVAVGLQLAREQLADSSADMKLLPDKLAELRLSWKKSISIVLENRDILKNSLKVQMNTVVDSRRTGNDYICDTSTITGRIACKAKEKGIFRDDHDPITGYIRSAYEIVKNRILQIADSINQNAGVEYAKIVNLLTLYDHSTVENIWKASCELSVETPEIFRQSAAAFAEHCNAFLNQQKLLGNSDADAMNSLSEKWFWGESGSFAASVLSKLPKLDKLSDQNLSGQDDFSFPEHLMTEVISYDNTLLLQNQLDILKGLQAGNVSIGTVGFVCETKCNDLVERLFDLVETRTREIDSQIIAVSNEIKHNAAPYLGVLSFELDNQQEQINREKEKIENTERQFGL